MQEMTPFYREFTTIACWKPLLEPCFQAMNEQCSCLGSSAHVWGQKLLTFRVIYHYGLNIQCYPDAHAVELVEKQVARQKEHPREPRQLFWAE